MRIRAGPAAIKISHMEKRQPRTGIANPETNMPIAGAQNMQYTHAVMA